MFSFYSKAAVFSAATSIIPSRQSTNRPFLFLIVSVVYTAKVCYFLIWKRNWLNSISLHSNMQSIHIPQDKKLPWRLSVYCLFGLVSETKLFPRAIFLFFIMPGGESKGHKIHRETMKRWKRCFHQTRLQIIWQSCKHILNLVHAPKKTKILKNKDWSREVHKSF